MFVACDFSRAFPLFPRLAGKVPCQKQTATPCHRVETLHLARLWLSRLRYEADDYWIFLSLVMPMGAQSRFQACSAQFPISHLGVLTAKAFRP